MHKTVQNLIDIENQLKSNLGDIDQSSLPKIIAVSKTFKMDKISPLVEHGHLDFGENKVQEAIEKWTEIKASKPNIQLHMIGKLQTNKVKFSIISTLSIVKNSQKKLQMNSKKFKEN